MAVVLSDPEETLLNRRGMGTDRDRGRIDKMTSAVSVVTVDTRSGVYAKCFSFHRPRNCHSEGSLRAQI